MKQLIKSLDTLTNKGQLIIKTIIADLEDVSSQVNYMQFDLEATRRERDNLKKQLDGDGTYPN